MLGKGRDKSNTEEGQSDTGRGEGTNKKLREKTQNRQTKKGRVMRKRRSSEGMGKTDECKRAILSKYPSMPGTFTISA